MENLEILSIARKIPGLKNYVNVLNNNQFIDFSEPPKKFMVYIFHLEATSGELGHFVCLIDKDKKRYFFDSFGNSPKHYNAKWESEYNSEVLQNESCLCGPFCLFVAFHSLQRSPKEVIRKFFQRSTIKRSEMIVFNWLNTYFTGDYYKLMKCQF